MAHATNDVMRLQKRMLLALLIVVSACVLFIAWYFSMTSVTKQQVIQTEVELPVTFMDPLTLSQQYLSYTQTSQDKQGEDKHQKDKPIADKPPVISPSADLRNFSIPDLSNYSNTIPHSSHPQPQKQPYTQLGENYFRRPWTNLTHLPWELYIFSAYYDTRLDMDVLATVRVVVVSENLKNRPMYCVVAYGGHSWRQQTPLHKHFAARVTLATVTVRDIGLGFVNHGKLLVEYVVTCKLKSARVKPTHVSVIGDVTSLHNEPLVYQPIESIPEPPSLQGYIVCEKTVYGHVSPAKIIEYVEMNRILGANKIVVYTHAVSNVTLHTLLHFAREGIVEVWESPLFLRETGFSSQVLHHTPVINDCMLRYGQSFRYAVVTDIDEFIIPRPPHLLTWDDLIQDLKVKYPPISPDQPRQYVFINLYFMFENKQDEQAPRYISSLRHRNRGAVSEPGYSVKTILDPRLCAGMHHHYCWGVLKGMQDGYNVDVPAHIGLNHHYKACHLSKEECRPLIENTYTDDTMLKYKSQLLAAVSKQVKQLQQEGVILEMSVIQWG